VDATTPGTDPKIDWMLLENLDPHVITHHDNHAETILKSNDTF